MSKETCKFTGFPRQMPCWWSMIKESCKFTGFLGHGPCWWSMSKQPCKFTGFLGQGPCGGMSKEPYKDFPNRSEAGGYAVSVTI